MCIGNGRTPEKNQCTTNQPRSLTMPSHVASSFPAQILVLPWRATVRLAKVRVECERVTRHGHSPKQAVSGHFTRRRTIPTVLIHLERPTNRAIYDDGSVRATRRWPSCVCQRVRLSRLGRPEKVVDQRKHLIASYVGSPDSISNHIKSGLCRMCRRTLRALSGRDRSAGMAFSPTLLLCHVSLASCSSHAILALGVFSTGATHGILSIIIIITSEAPAALKMLEALSPRPVGPSDSIVAQNSGSRLTALTTSSRQRPTPSLSSSWTDSASRVEDWDGRRVQNPPIWLPEPLLGRYRSVLLLLWLLLGLRLWLIVARRWRRAQHGAEERLRDLAGWKVVDRQVSLLLLPVLRALPLNPIGLPKLVACALEGSVAPSTAGITPSVKAPTHLFVY